MRTHWGTHRLDYLWPEVRSILRMMPERGDIPPDTDAERERKTEFLFGAIDALLVQRAAFMALSEVDQKALARFDDALRAAMWGGITALRELIAKDAARVG